MNWKTAILRLEAMIQKDEESIRGYELASTTTDRNFGPVIANLKNSIEKKKEAIDHINAQTGPYAGRINWNRLAETFKFNKYHARCRDVGKPNKYVRVLRPYEETTTPTA